VIVKIYTQLWHDVLRKLCVDLDDHLSKLDDEVLLDHYNEDENGNRTPSCLVAQIKEKFGGLRFYMNYHDDAVDALIEKAEIACDSICEVCGQPGSKRGGAWIRNLCDLHYAHALLRDAKTFLKKVDRPGAKALYKRIDRFLEP